MDELIPGIKRKRSTEDSENTGHELVAHLIQLCNSRAKLNGDKRQTVKCTELSVPGHATATLRSWKFDEFSYGNPNKPLPTDARGLFSYTNHTSNRHSIVLRGYDKFFNTDEVPATKWTRIEAETQGPYNLTLKQNGCIIFIGALDSRTILVSSKHSIGPRGPDESHSDRGHTWLKKHLLSAGKTEHELASLLYDNSLTAVCELCDDDFEEHILGYPPSRAGLYLHGLNLNDTIFSTYPIEDVNIFAAYFGLRSNTHISVPDIPAMKTLLADCAKTGTYDGVELEGFVVRTQTSGRDFFFKYKFEEPYLLFRQWREVTKAIIAGREPKFQLHKDITREYIEYILPIIQDPAVAKQYQANHGIISLRERFLTHRGGDLSEIIASALPATDQDSSYATDWQKDRFVLVPIATIGCGKTTISIALQKLFGFGHVQNDNILAKKSASLFAKSVYDSFELSKSRVVVADRNNHMFHERASLVKDVRQLRKILDPRINFIAISFVQSQAVRSFTIDRVLKRGDNHQSIKAATMDQDSIKGIMDGFHKRFQALNIHKNPDDEFTEVIEVDPLQGSRLNLEKITDFLHARGLVSSKPSSSQLDEAVNAGMTYRPEVTKIVTSHESQQKLKEKKQQNKKSDHKETSTHKKNSGGGSKDVALNNKGVNFYGLNVINYDHVRHALQTGLCAGDVVNNFWQQLCASGRVQNEFHITLIHESAKKTHTDIWEYYSSLSQENLAKTHQVVLKDIQYNDRVMAITADLALCGLPATNAIAHVTVGTANSTIKPVESNKMLASSDNTLNKVSLNLPVECRVQAYYR